MSCWNLERKVSSIIQYLIQRHTRNDWGYFAISGILTKFFSSVRPSFSCSPGEGSEHTQTLLRHFLQPYGRIQKCSRSSPHTLSPVVSSWQTPRIFQLWSCFDFKEGHKNKKSWKKGSRFSVTLKKDAKGSAQRILLILVKILCF